MHLEKALEDDRTANLGWPLKPFEKCLYIGCLVKAIEENIEFPSSLPRNPAHENLEKPEPVNPPCRQRNMP